MRHVALFIVVLALTLAGLPGARPAVVAATTGNGAPSGTHYNLNIIGVPHDKTADMNNNNGGRIFVQLFGGDTAGSLAGKTLSQFSKVNKIFLVPAPAGESFLVLDANPLADIANVRDARLVVTGGDVYTPNDLIERAAENCRADASGP